LAFEFCCAYLPPKKNGSTGGSAGSKPKDNGFTETFKSGGSPPLLNLHNNPAELFNFGVP
jgi:hypothetical protein